MLNADPQHPCVGVLGVEAGEEPRGAEGLVINVVICSITGSTK